MSRKGGSSTRHSSFGLGTATGVWSTRRSAFDRLLLSPAPESDFCDNIAAARFWGSVVQTLRVGEGRGPRFFNTLPSFVLYIPLPPSLRAYDMISCTLGPCSPTLLATLLLCLRVSYLISRSLEPCCHLLYSSAQQMHLHYEFEGGSMSSLYLLPMHHVQFSNLPIKSATCNTY